MKLVRSDYIMIVALVLLIGAHMTTNYIVWSMETVAQKVQVAESVVLQYEVNPVAQYFFKFQGLKMIFSYVIAPGILAGLYYFIRKKYAKEWVAVEAYSIAFLVVCLMNFLNDISIAMGMFL